MIDRLAASALALLLTLPATAAAAGAPTGKVPAVRDKLAIGGPGGWDYLSLDPVRKHLFISRSDRVLVMATDTGKIVGEIPGTAGVHGIAVVESLKRGFTSNGKADSVTVFDLETLKVTGQITGTGKNPDAILFDPASGHLLTFNGRSNDATVIDPVAGTVVKTVALDGKPEFAAADGHGRIYVNIEDKSELTEIDSENSSVIARWPLKDCEEPSGLAIDASQHRLFSVCGNQKMVVTDGWTGRRVAELPIGDGPDAAAYDAVRHRVYSSNGEGTLSVVQQDGADRYRLIATVPTQKSARTMALDAETGSIYMAAAQFGPPPAPTAEQPKPRPPMVADSFSILVVGAKESKVNP